MLPRLHRLSRGQDINRVYGRGRFAAVSGIQFKVLPNQMASSRAVTVVSKKVSKKAVVRNRLRRQVAGQLWRLWDNLSSGYDIVVIVREDLTNLSAAELRARLTAGLTRCNVMNSRQDVPHHTS